MHSNHVVLCIALLLAAIVLPAISRPTTLELQHEPQVHSETPTALPHSSSLKSKKKLSSNQPSKSKASTFCTPERPNTTNIESMTLSDLNEIINIVDPVINNTLPSHKKYLAVNYGERIFHSNDHYHAYRRLFDAVANNEIPKPNTIWMSHSPCLSCSRRLIFEYGRPESTKPTLQIASIDFGSSLVDTMDSLKCMAKMVHLNITITSWDWTEIRNNIHQAKCIQSVDSAQQDLGFMYSQNTIQKVVEFINELSLNPQVNTWCELFPSQ